jgi:hypothetical protein
MQCCPLGVRQLIALSPLQYNAKTTQDDNNKFTNLHLLSCAPTPSPLHSVVVLEEGAFPTPHESHLVKAAQVGEQMARQEQHLSGRLSQRVVL